MVFKEINNDRIGKLFVYLLVHKHSTCHVDRLCAVESQQLSTSPGKIIKPSFCAASLNLEARQTNSCPLGVFPTHTKAAVSWRLSAVCKGWF